MTIRFTECVINLTTTVTRNRFGNATDECIVKILGNILPTDTESEKYKNIQFSFDDTMAEHLNEKLTNAYKDQLKKSELESVLPYAEYIKGL